MLLLGEAFFSRGTVNFRNSSSSSSSIRIDQVFG